MLITNIGYNQSVFLSDSTSLIDVQLWHSVHNKMKEHELDRFLAALKGTQQHQKIQDKQRWLTLKGTYIAKKYIH